MMQRLLQEFGIELAEEVIVPRYNIAPGQDAPVVVIENGKLRLRLMRWGLIPFWAKDPAIGNKMINARAETLAEKPSFRKPFASQRCLVLADGFYEWRKIAGSKAKIPMRFVIKDRRPFAFAGLWDRWRNPSGGEIHSFTIITTAAGDFIRPIHDRMPIILQQDVHNQWLDPKISDAVTLSGILRSHAEGNIEAYDVGLTVNSPRNDVPECVVSVNR